MMLRSREWVSGLWATLVVSCATNPPNDDTKVTVIQPDVVDVSLPLRELAKIPVPVSDLRAYEAEPVRPIPHTYQQSVAQQPDPVVQSAIGGPNIPSTIVNFEGQGAGLAGFTMVAAPSDTDGDVGPNHYVQMVNRSVTIFDKTGGKLLGPVATNTLWNGFSDACATSSDGDSVVRYDRIADRWMISLVSANRGAGPFFECIAVSTTPDPTGSYTRYQFSFEALNDYPKVGLWPDAYYFTYNLFTSNVSGNLFLGARVCALDRVKMIAGDPNATQQCFDTGSSFGGLLPSDVDGPTLPPAGEPNLLVALGSNALNFFTFHVDFTTPASSTFSGSSPTTIPVAAFSPLCNGGNCVVQPGTTQQLASIADRLMNRLVYRNFGDHEALLVSHAVVAGTGGGIRFYELRLPGPCTAMNCPTPTIFQQGTYAPDSSFRWMSSMAFDQAGNMGMGFTVSSSTINPSVRYTGRLATDALGTMGQDEATLVAGTGSQTGISRWGDYSSMNIDPSDDCTFWYTQEYMSATGAFNWHTRIGKFKFANCGMAVNDFSITPSPASQTVTAGSSATYTINTAVLSGTAETVALSVSGLPAGITGTFSPTSVTAGGSSALTITVPAGSAGGTTQFTITGTAPSTTHILSASFAIPDNNLPPTVTITSPINGSTVSGIVTVSANASDTDGTVASVRFDLPDRTAVIDTTAPFQTTFDSTKVPNGAQGFLATVTDNQGATSTVSVTVLVSNTPGCLNNTFNATDAPKTIPDNNATGVTSSISVFGNGTIASLSLSLSITHPHTSDLVVTLISPAGSNFVVSNRAPGHNLALTNKAITAFDGQTAAGTWQLKVQDLASGNTGTLNSWSLGIVGNCTSLAAPRWSGSAAPNLPTIDNGTMCTSVRVPAGTGGDASAAKLDIAGSHAHGSALRGTLSHNGLTVEAFPTRTFPTGASTFSFTGRVQPGLTGSPAGTWTLCIADTDAFDDVGVLSTWAVHD